jgi:S-adenosylmethionine/arginine decarboxylase-like enzyme
MKYLANHQIVEFNHCEESKIDNSDFVREIFLKAAELGNATVINECFHTWPEHKYAAVDIFSCGNKVDYNKIIDYLKDNLKCKNCSSMSINRGNYE